jgi:hypothetical protein
MKNKLYYRVPKGWVLFSMAVAVLLGLASQARAVTVYGLTNTNGLVQFDSATPQNITFAVNNIGGLVANDDLIGIDFRPADGLLYGVGSGGGVAGSARVYTIDTTNGFATQVSTLTLSNGGNLTGSRFGFDFNPVADRLRVVSNADQNLRINVGTGATTVDTPVSYAAGDTFAGQDPNIVGSAYTNAFAGATSTTLYGIDSVHNNLVIQNPPNNGTLTTVGLVGIDATQLVGFDITFDPTTQMNIAFAALQDIAEGGSRFYMINLSTGLATPVGLEQGDLLDGIAIPVPEPSTCALLGLAAVGLGVIARRRSGVTRPDSPSKK